MCHERQSLNERLDLRPHFGEDGGIVGVSMTEAVHALAPIYIVIGFRLDERVERVGDDAVANNYHAHTAHAAGVLVGGFEVDGGKIIHVLMNVSAKLMKKDEMPMHGPLKKCGHIRRVTRLVIKQKNETELIQSQVVEWRRQDSNLRPLGYEPNELPLLHSAICDCKGTAFSRIVKSLGLKIVKF